MKSQKSDRIHVNNNGKMWNLWGIPLFSSHMCQVLKMVEDQISSNYNKPFWIVTANPEFVMSAAKDGQFMNLMQKTDLNVMDGVGLVWAKLVGAHGNVPVQKIGYGIKVGMEIMRGKYREELVPGVELMDRMCELAERLEKSVYFFGGWGDRAARTADCFVAKYPGLKVSGFRDENFDFETKTDFLFVARGMKKQEEWIEANLDRLKVGVVMGVGRSFDYYSGDLKRAPEWVRRMGLEWLYSLYKEPKRWRRQLALPGFVYKVLFD